jgi:hypothetical protein
MYHHDQRMNKMLGYLISFGITAINFCIRTINIHFVKLIRYHTVSQELRAITITIFLATFINTAFILLMSQANFT